MIRPDTSDDKNKPRIRGIVSSPDFVGEAPRLIWKYWLKKIVAPYIATPTKRLATVAMTIVRERNRWRGMIGSAARASVRMASPAIATDPPTIAVVCQDHQSKL
jgi:hypothetical protein